MRVTKTGVISILASGLLAGSVVGVAAQDEEAEATAEGTGIEVVGVEYAYEDLPTSIPAGTTLTFANDGVEIHEMAFNRIADGVTESFEELLAMDAAGVDLEAEGFLDTDFDGQQLLALPGQTADGSVTLDGEGRYVVLCFIPTGMEPAKLEELGVDISTLGPDTDPATLSPEAQAYIEEVSANPPHVALGMIQEFVVTAAGTEVGPLPAMDAAEEAADDVEEQADSKEDELEDKADAKEDELEDKADAKEDELEDKADAKEEELRDDG